MHIGIACKDQSLATHIMSFIPPENEISTWDVHVSLSDFYKTKNFDVMFCEALYPTRTEFSLWREISKNEITDLVLITHNNNQRLKELVPNLYGVIEGKERLSYDVLRVLTSITNERLLQPTHTIAMPSLGESMVVMHGKRIILTRMELTTLRILVEANGKYITANQLVSMIWGDAGVGKKEDLYVYISRLREKLEENPMRPTLIVSSRGMGYAFIGTTSILHSSKYPY
ncbi:MAG: helix-turn-helix domain-containing protein [Acidibacillus sp.]|uniref:OmpR/PhoB-type domain-containing protein n=1 Tax=Sulfoacidibacillus ferrooxidans TaxID=2005001 RepID=A0A9X1V7L4_9BACL|nr:helix-turn-helix domain-containing protein [Sulfoacidibacillus ferrooxidans]MCI0182672.1 hypothetical protein [Sulfoacidibacillus ferrooxidans]MCY0894056.1 helix-turn-helix domain-containing protein [Acidibacillus sp.]